MPPRKRKGPGPRARGVKTPAVPTAAPDVNDNAPPPKLTNLDVQNEQVQTLTKNTQHDKSDCVPSEEEQKVQSQTLPANNSSDAVNNILTESAASVKRDTESVIKEGLGKKEEKVVVNDAVVTGDGNVEGDERRSVGESVDTIPKKRVVRKVVKVVKKVVKKKVPKKFETGGIVESYSNEEGKSGACDEVNGRKDSSAPMDVLMGGVAVEVDGEKCQMGQEEEEKDAKAVDFKDVGNSNELPDSVSLEAMEVDRKDNGEIGGGKGGKEGKDGKVGFRKDIGNLNELPLPVEGSSRNDETTEEVVEEGSKVSVLVDTGHTKPELSANYTDECGNVNISEVPEERRDGSDHRDSHGSAVEVNNSCFSSGKRVFEETEGVGGSNEGFVWSGEMEALERRKRRKTEIFIGGLVNEVEEEDIRKVFEEVGDVVEVRLLKKNSGGNKGYAFIRFATAADAKKALEKYPQVEVSFLF